MVWGYAFGGSITTPETQEPDLDEQLYPGGFKVAEAAQGGRIEWEIYDVTIKDIHVWILQYVTIKEY